MNENSSEEPCSEKTRYLLGLPIRGMRHVKHSFIWKERSADGMENLMWWTPTTEEEIAQSERFYAAALAIDWSKVGPGGVDGALVCLPPCEDLDEK